MKPVGFYRFAEFIFLYIFGHFGLSRLSGSILADGVSFRLHSAMPEKCKRPHKRSLQSIKEGAISWLLRRGLRTLFGANLKLKSSSLF
jgi:hypothetical protein